MNLFGHLRLARAAEDFGQDFNQMVPATVEIIVALRSFQAQEIEQTVKITDRFLNWGSELRWGGVHTINTITHQR